MQNQLILYFIMQTTYLFRFFVLFIGLSCLGRVLLPPETSKVSEKQEIEPNLFPNDFSTLTKKVEQPIPILLPPQVEEVSQKKSGKIYAISHK